MNAFMVSEPAAYVALIVLVLCAVVVLATLLPKDEDE